MSQFSDFDFDMSGTFQSWEAYAWSNPSESVPLASSAFSSAVPVFHHVPYTCSMQPSANHEALHGRELGDIAMPGSNPASSQMPVRSTALISQNTRWKRAPTSKDWTTHRSRITELYKDHTLPELREILRQETGFAASEKSFKDHINTWNLNNKYLPTKVVGAIVRKREQRAQAGKRSVVVFRGRTVTDEEIKNRIRRRKGRLTETALVEIGRHREGTPDGLQVFSPRPASPRPLQTDSDRLHMETLYHTRYWILASVKTEYLGKTLPSASDNLFRTLDLDLEVLRRHRVEEYCNRHAVYLPCDIAHLGFHRKVLGYCKHVVSAVTKLVIREFGQWDELSRVFHLSLELLRLYPRMAIVLERVYQYLLDLCRYAIEPTHPLTLLITNLLSLKHIEREQVMLCAWRLIINSTYGVTGPHFVLYVSVWGYTKLETDDYGLDITYDAIHKTLISSFGEDEQPAFYMGEALLLDSLRRFQDAESAAHQTLQLQLRTGSSCSETEFFIHSACHRVLASCREAMGDIPSAVDHLEYALELKLRDRVTAPDPDRIIDVTERLVRHYIKLGNNQAAKKAQTRLALWKAKRPPPEFPLLFECEDADCILPVTWNDAS